ncbi:MAG: nucleotide exchange factor GrpE [Oscillospiraceae bacterium]
MKDEEKKKHPKEEKHKNKKDKCECHGKEECKCHEQHEDQKIKDLEEALLRKDADMINYRKRKDEEVTKMLMYSKEDIAKDLLPIVDNFERAINLDDDNLDDELSKFLEGFKMIYCHLTEILNKYEIKAIDGANKPFDPNYHQGVLTEKVEGMEPGVVIEVLQKGYLLKDKVIRHAMVKVSE